MSSYGSITVNEQCFRYQGRFVRPFSQSARVYCRQYSRLLERTITDFGADGSLQSAAAKIEEHYGIALARSSVKNTTLKHAHKMLALKKRIHKNYHKSINPKVIVGEIDGTMVPIVETDSRAKDRRKKKTLSWKESCLSRAYTLGTLIRAKMQRLGQRIKQVDNWLTALNELDKSKKLIFIVWEMERFG